ncbi:hypothetical protein HF206_38155, partial [Rhizobium leguminosarum]
MNFRRNLSLVLFRGIRQASRAAEKCEAFHQRVEANLHPMEQVSCCEKRMTVSKPDPIGAAMPAIYFTETEYQARLAATKVEMQASG